ncbi:MAG TPA: hypothetical protein VKY40_00745, partial [Halanaerobiales bacterium]|nr:hypothetical protein [Halanaerobiales bacterium]
MDINDYKLNENGFFIIKNFQKKDAFSSFLPGIAGKKGIPVWAFYVNRGQGMVSFGLQDKDHATQKRGQMVDFDLDEGEYQLINNEYGYEEWVKDILLTGTTTLEAELIAYNLLGNGDFSEDVFMDADENGEGNFDTENNWLYLLNTESVSGTAVVESEEVLIDIDTGEGPFYAIQLIQAPLMIEQGTMYRVSFEARADSQR